MIRHSRLAKSDNEADVVAHVRAHLSSVASETDDPDEFGNEVIISREDQGATTLILGTLDRQPVASYLRDDWTPEQDIADNPLSVASIEDLS